MTTQLRQSEKDLQRATLELAQARGWRTAHFHDSRREVTRRSGQRLYIGDKDAKGFPDFFAIRAPRIVIAEFKSETGKVRPDQQAWLDQLKLTAEVFSFALALTCRRGSYVSESTVVLVDMDDNPHLDERTKKRALAGLSKRVRGAGFEVYTWRPSDWPHIEETLR